MCSLGAEHGTGEPIPLPNADGPTLARVLQFCERRVAESSASELLHPVEASRLAVASACAQRLAAILSAACAEANESERLAAAEAAEAQRVAAAATAAAARAAERLAAAKRDSERLAAEASAALLAASDAQAALQAHEGRIAITPPQSPVPLGAVAQPFPAWEQELVAPLERATLLRLIVARRTPTPPTPPRVRRVRPRAARPPPRDLRSRPQTYPAPHPTCLRHLVEAPSI